jgi:chaperonin GroEL
LPELIGDIALFTGATVQVEAAGQRWPRDLHGLGAAQRVRVRGSELQFVGGAGSAEAIELRLAALRERIARSDAEAHDALRQRIGRLAERSAVVRVGASTEIEFGTLVSHAHRALRAGRAAPKDGVIPGGGVALLRTAEDVLRCSPQGVRGASCLVEAVQALIAQLATNAGADGRAIVEYVCAATGSAGFNVDAARIEDLRAAGILDPVRVVRLALANAVSVACIVLGAGGLLTERH